MTPAHYLLCYDIRHPRRLNRVFKTCVRVGIPYQRSVFLLSLNTQAVQVLLNKLSTLIEVKQDDVRLYRLGSAQATQCLGPSVLPEGIWLTGEPFKGLALS